MTFLEYLRLIWIAISKPKEVECAITINRALKSGSSEAIHDIKFTDTLYKRVTYRIVVSKFEKV